MHTDILKDFIQLGDSIVLRLLWQEVYGLHITPRQVQYRQTQLNIPEFPKYIYFASFLFPPTPHPPNQKIPGNTCNVNTFGTKSQTPQEHAAGDVNAPSIYINVASDINGSLKFATYLFLLQ